MNDKISPRRYLFDVLIRAALGVTFAFAAGACIQGGIAGLRGIDFAHPQPHQLVHVLSIFAIALYTVMVACLYVVRLPPVSKFAGIIPCAAAILGGFLMGGLLLLNPRDDLPLWLMITASLLVVVGDVLATIILLRLGRSFSILPEGRRLITTGPYAFVRHPLYLAEAVSTLGAVINFLSPWALVLFATQFSLQVVRIHYEEKVLKEHFPEYEEYAKKTWRLIPGVY